MPEVQASRTRGFAPEVAIEVKAVADLLAEGLGEPQARAAIHSAMRESPLTDHALVLSEFVGTQEGARVLGAVAELTGVAEADLRQRVAALPSLQLYLPNRAQRRSWRAAESVAVVALTDEVSPLQARLAGGGRIALSRNSRTPATTTAILVLGPREAFLTRRDAGSPRTRTDVIEESFDGPMRDDLECQGSECDEGGGGGGSGGGGGGGGSSGTIVSLRADTLMTFGVCDNCGWPFDGSNEFEIKAFDGGGYQLNATIRCEGVGEHDTVVVSQRCIGGGSGDHSILWGPVEYPVWDVYFSWRVYVQETDGWPNGDDHWFDFRDWTDGVPVITQSSLHSQYITMWEWAQRDCWDAGCDARLGLHLSW